MFFKLIADSFFKLNKFSICFLLIGSFYSIFLDIILFENVLFLKDSVNFKKFWDLFLFIIETFLVLSIVFKFFENYFYFSLVFEILGLYFWFERIEVLTFLILIDYKFCLSFCFYKNVEAESFDWLGSQLLRNILLYFPIEFSILYLSCIIDLFLNDEENEFFLSERIGFTFLVFIISFNSIFLLIIFFCSVYAILYFTTISLIYGFIVLFKFI